MLITFFRTIILYFLIVFSLRFTGKRQVGEMQPTDLVITLMVSEIASIPLENSDSPLSFAIIPILILVALEVIISGISMKSTIFRRVFTGRPIIVINDGKIDQKALKSLRITIEDLLDSLRINGVFDPEDVKYAIYETNGQLSVLQKEETLPASSKDSGIKPEKKEIPFTVIKDGSYITHNLKYIKLKLSDIKQYIAKQKLNVKDIMLMTADKSGNFKIIRKDKEI